MTTSRGKNELEDYTHVAKVDHNLKIVVAGPKKATLNAPLLDRLFQERPNLKVIVHYHEQSPWYPTLDYAEPGTVMDSIRYIPTLWRGFNIRDHGVFLLFDYTPTEKDATP